MIPQNKPAKLTSLLLSGTLVLFANQALAEFRLTSEDIKDGVKMSKNQEYAGFGCVGSNRSPQLSWSGAPPGTKSYAITVYDPDAPTGSGWWHWQLINIPAEVSNLPANAGDPNSKLAPAGSEQRRSDYGNHGFGGACPPPGHGVHRYQFTVYALSVENLALPEAGSAALVGFNLNSHALATAKITALYQR